MKKRIIYLLGILVTVILLSSCEGNAKVALKADGAVSFEFTGSIGDAFKEMMSSAGNDLSTIDEEGIKLALEQSGFSNVFVVADVLRNDIVIKFEDKTRSSYLFQTEIVSVKDDKEVNFNITAGKFLKLYNAAGEDIQMLLDLFLSPVLNDEEMSEKEYIETIAVTYGEDAGKEIDDSSVKFTIVNKDGKKKSKSIFGKSILCGAEISL